MLAWTGPKPLDTENPTSFSAIGLLIYREFLNYEAALLTISIKLNINKTDLYVTDILKKRSNLRSSGNQREI
jgi:hypothetical protein